MRSRHCRRLRTVKHLTTGNKMLHLPHLDRERCRAAAELCVAAAIPLCAAIAIFILLSAAFDIGPKVGPPEGRYADATQWGR